MRGTGEVAVEGKTSGPIEPGEFVEWEATHLFVKQRLSSKITEMQKPHYFVDEMIKGAFKSFKHRHEVRGMNEDTVLLIDDFQYQVPFGFLGHITYLLFLKSYMEKMFVARSNAAKAALESDAWKKYLDQ